MFKTNKYTQAYFAIIERAQNRSLEGYQELHHVIPKSLGGEDCESNLVSLTAKEHFICHLLLTKMTNSWKLKQALYLMTVGNQHQVDRQIKLSSSLERYIKRMNSEGISLRMIGNTPSHKGKKRFFHYKTREQKFFKEEDVPRGWKPIGLLPKKGISNKPNRNKDIKI